MRTPSTYLPGRWYCTLPPDVEGGVIGVAFTDAHGQVHRFALPLRDAVMLQQSLAEVPADQSTPADHVEA